MTGELRRFLKQEVDRLVRARPDYVSPEVLERREAQAAREREGVCIECGQTFRSTRRDAQTCPGSSVCRVRRLRRLRRAGREAVAA